MCCSAGVTETLRLFSLIVITLCDNTNNPPPRGEQSAWECWRPRKRRPAKPARSEDGEGGAGLVPSRSGNEKDCSLLLMLLRVQTVAAAPWMRSRAGFRVHVCQDAASAHNEAAFFCSRQEEVLDYWLVFRHKCPRLSSSRSGGRSWTSTQTLQAAAG